jgi:fibronectin type 3 domain-containing protein
MLRRLQADPYTGGAASLLFRSAALVLGRLYADTTAQPGAEYEYRVTLLDAAGRETNDVRSARVRVVDVPPAAPTGVAGVAGNEEATLGWRFPAYRADPRDFVVAFRLYRAVGAGAAFEPVTDLPLLRAPDEAHDFTDRGLRNDVEYRYQLRAVDVAGRESAPSATVAVRPFDDSPPLAPEDLVTEPGDGRVRLVWRMSPEMNVTGYHVERSTGIDQPFGRVTTALIPAGAPGWTDEAVRGGTQYFYRLIAVNDRGKESKPGNAISAVPLDETPPEPPTAVTATADDRRLVVRWQPSASDDVLGYHVYRGDAPDRVSRLTTRPIAATEYLDVGFDERGLNPGGRYVVRVSAVDHAFNESEHVEVRTQIADDEPPAAPTALQLRNVEGRRVEISWSAGGSLDVERYRLTRISTDATGEVEVGTAPADGRLLLEDTQLQSGVEYGYRLVAVDSAGNASEPAEARLLFARPEPPPAPRRTTATLAADGRVEVRWERVIDRELVGYRVYRATLATGVYAPVSELIAPGAALVFTDSGGGARYYYTVRAVDRSGNESRPSPAAVAGR